MSGDADDEPILLDSPRAPAATRARCFGATDVGRVREHNEDAFVVGDLERAERQGSDVLEVGGARGALLVVCDGMGGAEGGEVAADLAARTVWSEMRDAQTTDSPEVFARLLRRALRAANRYAEVARPLTVRPASAVRVADLATNATATTPDLADTGLDDGFAPWSDAAAAASDLGLSTRHLTKTGV